MAQPVSRVKFTEKNNYPQGRSGSKVKRINGPAVGSTSGNATKKGGIMSPTHGKKK